MRRCKVFSIKSRLQRKYQSPKNSMYTHRFFEDLSSGYASVLGKREEKQHFFSFEPKECKINNLLKGHHYYSSYDIERIVDRITYSLMAYGNAFFYIQPEYFKKKENDITSTQILSSIEIGEIEGIIKKKTKEGYIFCSLGFDKAIREIEISKEQLVILDIKEVGLSKKYFRQILTKLSKCDFISKNTDMIKNNSGFYDFTYHYERKKLAELKAIRSVGWSFGTEKLSDSYLLYKKIQGDVMKIRFLEYIVKKINEGLQAFLGDDAGKLVAHINKKDYEQLWNDYAVGKITGTELTSILYNV